MATSFTVILLQRQHFGSEPAAFESELRPPFVGLQKDFSFNCPSVDASETAYLMFQSYKVAKTEVLQINGVDVYGGVPATKSIGWSANILLVEPRHQLKAAGNIMHVESTGRDFIIDNVVIAYKTRLAGDQPPIRSRKSPAKRGKRH